METFSERLKKLREKKRVTQSEMSLKCGFSRYYISQVENCYCTNPTAENLQAMADYLGVTMDYLWRGKHG